jgi:hypothetical protein
MVLAVGVTVMYPSAARADSIRAQEGAVSCALDARITAVPTTNVQSGQVASAQHSEQLAVSTGSDATFLTRGGLEQSAYFANHGSTYLFADDRSSFHDAISAEGLGVNLDTHITIALRAGEEKTYLGGEVCVMKVPDGAPETSTTPEPASLLLIGTGLAGLLLYRRQLFA